jgi:signal recognition particle GTPase
MAKRGLYANIHAKRKRIAAGSGEKMRKAGAKGAPTAKQFKQAAKTAKTTTKKKSSRTSKKRG